jgi:hypothetical protein
MTQIATPSAVLGRFDDVTLELFGNKYHLERDGDSYWVDIESPTDPDQKPRRVRRQVVMTTGSHHMQAYWFESTQTRLVQLLPFVYLLGDERWVPRRSVFMRSPSRPTVGSDKAHWNRVCIQCHATHGVPEMVSRDLVDTRVAEFGIACEACHGPAEDHVRLRRKLREQSVSVPVTQPKDPIVQPRRLTAARASQVCGQCHSAFAFYNNKEDYNKWNKEGFRYRPGDTLTDTVHVIRRGKDLHLPVMRNLERSPTFMNEKFWSDGMLRVAGREYSGLIETPCYERGELSCLSCHVMHRKKNDERPFEAWADDQLKPGMEGKSLHASSQRACIGCHEAYQDPAQVTAHTHHNLKSSGSECYNCHMPHTSYGLLKAIRSHQIDSPSVQASLETGRPNACNLCHLDKSLGWTADQLQTWYGVAKPNLTDDQRTITASLLWLLYLVMRVSGCWSRGAWVGSRP